MLECPQVKLLVLAQARQWLSAAERLDPIPEARATPKTRFQLADAIKQPKLAEYAPFGCDFEDAGAYSPVISRLLLYAEIHQCSDHAYGTFSTPTEKMMYTYRELQECIIERRKLQQRSAAAESSAGERVGTAEDLAAKLCAFASDGIVVKHLIEFALPAKQRAEAVEVTEDTKAPEKLDVILSQHTAKRMADSFFTFVEQEHLQQHLQGMSAGQILVLCIFHSRLSWQKGKPLELHDRDHYWIPKPSYTPAEEVKAPSPPAFVQRIQQSATEHVPPEMQPPRTCCLCGKGFIDAPGLWKHCEVEHHSWAEAAKRALWEAEQIEAIPLLPPDKRRIIQNFTNALVYSKPGEGHFGRDKVCMRQRVGCATCAKVSWIDSCFPCFLFQDCPAVLRPRAQNDAADSETEALGVGVLTSVDQEFQWSAHLSTRASLEAPVDNELYF